MRSSCGSGLHPARYPRLGAAALIIGAFAASIGAFVASGARALSGACPAVLVIGSRGSGEADGLGAPVGLFVKEFKSDLAKRGVSAASLANTYPAVSVALSALAKDAYKEPLRLNDAYSRSVGQGRDLLKAQITTTLGICPSQKLILAGYSQGAQAAGDVYTALAASSAPADRSEFSHIFGVVLFADPDYNHLEKSDVVTGFQKSHQSTLRNDGILVHSPITRPRSFPASTAGRVLSYCIATDPVCQGLGQLAHGTGAHGAYGKPGAPQPADAAAYFSGRVAKSSPPAPAQGSVAGTWSGPVHQPGAVQTDFEVKLQIPSPVGSTPGIEQLIGICDGSLTYSGVHGSVYSFQFTTSSSQCVNGMVSLTLLSADKLRYDWSGNGAASTGVLTRSQ